jgi:hypothetical protein
MKFELDRLIDYDDDEILAELKRVAAIAPEGTFSRRIFEQHSRVSEDGEAAVRLLGGYASAGSTAGQIQRRCCYREADGVRRQADDGCRIDR